MSNTGWWRRGSWLWKNDENFATAEPMKSILKNLTIEMNFLFSFEIWDQGFQEYGGEVGVGTKGVWVEAPDDYIDIMVEFEEEENDDGHDHVPI